MGVVHNNRTRERRLAWLAMNRALGLPVGPPAAGELMIQGWGTANDHASGQLGAGQGWLAQSAVVAGNQVQHLRDGSLTDSRTKYKTGSDRITGGAELDGEPELVTSIGAVRVFDRALTPSERAHVDAYLAAECLSGT